MTAAAHGGRPLLGGTLSHTLVLLAGLAAVVAVMARLSPNFLDGGNLLNATRFMAEIGVISLGMAVVIIAGGIDLSVGSIMALCAVSMGLITAAGVPPVAAALLTLGVGTLAGSLNGAVIVRAGLPPIIVTLATLAVFRGLALGISGANAYPIPAEFEWLGQGYIGPLPVQLVVLAVVAVAVGILLHATTFGRTTYAVGANPVAALFSGLAIGRARAVTYALSGGLSGLAALIFVSRVSSAKANAGQGYELDAITIVVLAGIPISGGRGSIVNVLLGLAIVGLARNGMTLAFVQSEVQAVVIGSLLIAAVLGNWLLERLAAGRPASGRAISRETGTTVASVPENNGKPKEEST